MFSDNLVSGFSKQQLVLSSAFFRRVFSRVSDAFDNGTRFVHYTSAENALRIIRSNEVTLRNARLMNDYSEGQYGLSIVQQVFLTENSLKHRFNGLFESIHVGLPSVVDRYFQLYGESRFTDTFMLSLSEHGGKEIDEDKYGRLSMWRAYGGDTNVALVVNNAPLVGSSGVLKAYTSPVLYLDEASFQSHFSTFLDNVEEQQIALSEMPMDEVARSAAYALHVATLSTKHPAFSEEREWRVIYSPMIESSSHVTPDVIPIGGIPQRVYKIKLQDIPEEGLAGMAIDELLDRILIGPTQYPWPLIDAFVSELTAVGVQNPERAVWNTGIPLRK